MADGPIIRPQPRFRDYERVWFLQRGMRIGGTVELTVYELGHGYLYQVRVSPMAVFWADESELHHQESVGE